MMAKPCRKDLLQWINVVSFAIDDVKLFWIPIRVTRMRLRIFRNTAGCEMRR